MDKLKGPFPIRPVALIRKKAHSRIVKFTGDAQRTLKSPSALGFLGFVKEYFEVNRRLFTAMVSFFEELFSGRLQKKSSTAVGKEAGPVEPPRKAVIISIEDARNYE